MLKKKVCVFFSGRITAWQYCIDELKKKFFDSYEVDFFLSLDQEKEDDDVRQLITRLGSVKYVYYEKVNLKMPNLPISSSEVKLHSTLSMFYHTYMNFQIIREYAMINHIIYHAVIKFRIEIRSDDIFHIPNEILPNTIYIPNGSNYRGINDQIAYGTLESMTEYCDVFLNIPKYVYVLKCIFNSEYLLMFHLNLKNMNIFRFPYDYYLDFRRANKLKLDSSLFTDVITKKK